MSVRAERAGLAEKGNSIVGRAYREGRPMTGEEHQEWTRINAEVDALKGRIDADERRLPYARPNKRFCNWLGGKTEADGPFAKRDSLNFELADQAPRSLGEARALNTITLSAGGALVAAESPFPPALELALQSHDGVREAGATEVRTATGLDMPYPVVKDTQSKGAIVRDGVAQGTADPTFSVVKLGAYTYSSLEVQLPIALFQDSGFPVEQLLGNVLGERIARAQSEHFVAGTGADQPKGVLLSAADSTITTASATALTHAELVALQHSVDPAYRAKGTFMLNDATLLSIRQTVDTTGRPLWTPGISIGASDSICGRPYVVSPYMPAIGAGVKSVLFGDFSRYVIRTVTGSTLTVLRERYAERGILGFLLFIRSDGGLADAGNPIKYITQKS